jgi:hypothetical protein
MTGWMMENCVIYVCMAAICVASAYFMYWPALLGLLLLALFVNKGVS